MHAGTTYAGPMRSPEATVRGPLSADELRRLDASWRAADYQSVGQTYLLGNPLLRERPPRSTSSQGCVGTAAGRRS